MLIIQKFGGSSVATPDHIKHIATIVQHTYRQGHRVIVVVSAMGDETDRLIQLMQQVTDEPQDREYAALLASGEQVSSALVAMALARLGIKSRSYCGFQIELLTQTQYRKARVSSVNSRKLLDLLDQDIVPVIAGFQGINEFCDITTLGRGGSDITAVALAAFLHADECQIFTDVDGVYSADPRVVSQAQLIADMSYDEMLAFAQLGAKVLQTNSVEMARKYNVPVRVLSSMAPSRGTLITNKKTDVLVSGIACVDNQVKVTVCGLTSEAIASVLQHMQDELIEYDMHSQHSTDSGHDMSFTMSETELPRLCQLSHDFHIQSGMAKISLVGQGMQGHAGFAATILQLLAKEAIHIHSIISTEIKVSILISSSRLVDAVKLLHHQFDLHAEKA